jgi:hypothetical protein
MKAVPADVDVAVRCRGLDASRDDLIAMLKAMSPGLTESVEAGLANPLDQVRQNHGDASTKWPFVGVLRFGPRGGGGTPPFAILVLKDDYKGVIKSFSSGKEPKSQPDGLDSFEGPHGDTWFSTKGAGFAAFGPDKALVAAVAKPGAKTLDQVLTPALSKPFLAGDVGLFVNAAALATRYADQIDQARQQFMAALDQAGQQMGNAAQMEAAKTIYGSMFDALKYADALCLGLDFTAEGFHLAGDLTVKPRTDAAKSLASSRTGAADLGRFERDATVYAYMNLDASAFDRFQNMTFRMLSPGGGKLTAEQEKAVARFHGLGRIASGGAMSFGEGGLRGLSVMELDDPKAYVEAQTAMLRSMKGDGGGIKLYKDLKVEENAQTYNGVTFTHVAATVDLEKLAELGGKNPGGVAGMKAMVGDGSQSFWYGAEGKRLFQMMTPSWDEAKARLDAYLMGEQGLGGTAGFKAVRSKLPDRASLMMLMSVQGLARLFATQFSAMANKPDLKPPADMPKEPALFGFSLTPAPGAGYEFHFVVPSAVGPAVEKGIIPLFRALQGAGNP